MAGASEASVILTAKFVGTDTSVSASWTQSSDPVVDLSVGDSITYIDVSGGSEKSGASMDQFSVVDYFTFAGGGFETQGVIGDHGFGDLIFSNTVTAPHFVAGMYTLDDGVLTLSAVPEPTEWTLMLIGFGLAGASLRLGRGAGARRGATA
jgi:hypothetical protein